ncbi:MAG: hypothetical protein COT91_03455 [Candidatus Doudnabacteria bacterium CG10_big_fil_rev_8_21_14_0_10_41_10]|uniref:Uncharacterized protein n=1 Tax=Candidatus Doudnabacteria bacterium CG10_big_fil_rev_8_21_14_0_10_41_10 TaxID=1974551 RepID=A0A2H0VD59_9BACT|nr:MAG: hypothetical protein COT91_03455 [Candidatus Doudnabacteria bacterium CG10_big_fil_rev_8_21_14_0_10_41_10]
MTELQKAARIERLVAIANESKNSEDYKLANIVFAVLVWENPEGTWELETDDERGEYVSEVYYDLAVFIAPSGARVCIPVPLLTPYAGVTFLKRAKIVSRLRHERKVSKKQDTTALWDEFLAYVSSAAGEKAISLSLVNRVDMRQVFDRECASRQEKLPGPANLAEFFITD